MVILIVNAPVVAVLELPKELVRTLHWSQAGMYMCSPVFVPHMTGGAFPQGLVTAKVSVWHSPMLLPLPAAVLAGPIVIVVTVTGLFSINVSKSSLIWHTEEELLHTVCEQVVPNVLSVDVKYVQFSDAVAPQDFSKTQQTPKLLAQDPLELPPLELHSDVV